MMLNMWDNYKYDLHQTASSTRTVIYHPVPLMQI